MTEQASIPSVQCKLPLEDEVRIAMPMTMFDVQGSIGILENGKSDRNGNFAVHMRRTLTNLLALEKAMYCHRHDSQEHATTMQKLSHITRIFSQILYKPTKANGDTDEEIKEWEIERQKYHVVRNGEYASDETVRKATLSVTYNDKDLHTSVLVPMWRVLVTVTPLYTYGRGFEGYAGQHPDDLLKDAAYTKATKLNGLLQIATAREQWKKEGGSSVGITIQLFEPADSAQSTVAVRVVPVKGGYVMQTPIPNHDTVSIPCAIRKNGVGEINHADELTSFAEAIASQGMTVNGGAQK